MDNCSSQVSDDMIRIGTGATVRIITYAPHTTQVFQVLDLTLFDIPKGCPRYELSFDDDNATVKVIMKVYHDFRQKRYNPLSGESFTFRHLDLSFP
jgi:hypothetical protein